MTYIEQPLVTLGCCHVLVHVFGNDDHFRVPHGILLSHCCSESAASKLNTSEQTNNKAKPPDSRPVELPPAEAEPLKEPGPLQDTLSSPGRDSAKNTQDWIAEVSHELRLPIANIKLLVETLLDGAVDDAPTAKRMLLRAKTEVDRLHALVVDLLSVETVSHSREVHCEWIALDERAKSARETLQKQSDEKSIQLNVVVAGGFQIYANAAQLDQVLLNLLENAIKFTPTGGNVSVNSHERPGCFSVSDSGIGIPAHEIPKIFERFYRVDRAQSRGSTGLGLSIVKNIVDLHGAKITVTSKEGAGSTFSLEFPGPRAQSMETRKSP
jgi:signal transduction histidine kinase